MSWYLQQFTIFFFSYSFLSSSLSAAVVYLNLTWRGTDFTGFLTKFGVEIIQGSTGDSLAPCYSVWAIQSH